MGRSDPAMSSRMLSPFQASGLYRNLWQQYANDKSSQSGDTSPAILNSQYWRPSRGPFYAQLVETPGDRDTMSSFLNTVN
ncbi:hypothetical protein HDE_06736 [Halotydeus destructor]|nr:hypothetical protein HDE_06736 [Halotydeus destructor]